MDVRSRLSDKVINELKTFIKNKFVVMYYNRASTLGTTYYSSDVKVERSDTVEKVTRPMTLDDVFRPQQVDQNLKKIYELEVEVAKYKEIVDSVKKIKGFINET